MMAVSKTAVSLPTQPSMKQGYAFPNDVWEAVRSLASLQADWSSYAAPKPTVQSIIATIGVLEPWCQFFVNGAVTYEIGPSLDGGVDVTIDRGDEWVSFFITNEGPIVVERSDGEELRVEPGVSLDAHKRWLFGKR